MFVPAVAVRKNVPFSLRFCLLNKTRDRENIRRTEGRSDAVRMLSYGRFLLKVVIPKGPVERFDKILQNTHADSLAGAFSVAIAGSCPMPQICRSREIAVLGALGSSRVRA